MYKQEEESKLQEYILLEKMQIKIFCQNQKDKLFKQQLLSLTIH